MNGRFLTIAGGTHMARGDVIFRNILTNSILPFLSSLPTSLSPCPLSHFCVHTLFTTPPKQGRRQRHNRKGFWTESKTDITTSTLVFFHTSANLD
jgi:hypothetical protein